LQADDGLLEAGGLPFCLHALDPVWCSTQITVDIVDFDFGDDFFAVAAVKKLLHSFSGQISGGDGYPFAADGAFFRRKLDHFLAFLWLLGLDSFPTHR